MNIELLADSIKTVFNIVDSTLSIYHKNDDINNVEPLYKYKNEGDDDWYIIKLNKDLVDMNITINQAEVTCVIYPTYYTNKGLLQTNTNYFSKIDTIIEF
jgi:hypothetical protein